MDDASTSRPSLSSGDLCVDTCQEHEVRAARHQHTSWSTHFPKGNGLQATPISAFTNGSVYSIVQLCKPLSVSGYQRLLDFNAGVVDTGTSHLSGNLLAYPIAAGTGAALISTTANG